MSLLGKFLPVGLTILMLTLNEMNEPLYIPYALSRFHRVVLLVRLKVNFLAVWKETKLGWRQPLVHLMPETADPVQCSYHNPLL